MNDTKSWLTELTLEIASQISEMRPNILITINSNNGSYDILEKVGGSDKFNLYRCLINLTKESVPRIGILKIAIDKNDGGLDKEAFILRSLQETAQEIDSKRNPKIPAYNYGYFIPDIVDTFICTEQDNRKVNVLGFCEEIESTSQLTSISADDFVNEKIRIDGKTSVWILGKLLKIIGFSHQNGVLNNMIIGQNVLIEKEKHGVILFDWTNATISDDISIEATRQEIICATKTIVAILGGDPQTGELPDDQEVWYQNLIQRLIRGEFYDAFTAHKIFYKTVFEHWPKIMYPFTTLPTKN